tara:strand:- start:3031 stop:4275 length:1245 start_codon:yes stop_codon:yes gene_type:complete
MSRTDSHIDNEIDFCDVSLFAEGPPYALFDQLRSSAPVSWSKAPSDWPLSEGTGYWNLVRAADIAEVMRDSERFSSNLGGVTIPSYAVGSLEAVQAMIIGKDPPQHTQQRKTVMKAFTPRRISDLEISVRENVRQVINKVIEAGRCDFVSAISGPLPMTMIADLLGVPQEDRPQLFDWTDAIFGFHDPDAPLSAMDALEQSTQYMISLDEQRQRCPKDDLITVIGRAEIDGKRLPVEERAGIFNQLFAAGVDTTRATLALGIQALIEHPEQRRLLIEQPALIPLAVEEINRWVSVAQYMRRTALKDTLVGDQLIRQGEAVVCWQAAGNRDPERFNNPNHFDVARSECPHQSFGGGGRHLCLGSSLARMELRIAIEQLLRRMPDMELDGPVVRTPSNWIQNVKAMPVKFSPGTRE